MELVNMDFNICNLFENLHWFRINRNRETKIMQPDDLNFVIRLKTLMVMMTNDEAQFYA